jgi:outer membrane protein assembly factor BamB
VVLPERGPLKLATAVFVLLLLTVWTLSSAGQTSAQSPSSSNWTGVDANYPLNWNYSPQQSIDQSNVNSLQVAWTFPIPGAGSNYTGAEGAMVTPLVVDGILYAVANWHRLFALDASNGAVVWYRDLPLMKNWSDYLQPSIPGPNGIPLGHYHQMIYTSHVLGRPLVWVISNTYQIFALDADTGDIVVNFNPLLLDAGSISGNHGIYDVDTPTILIDEQRGMLLFGPSVSEGQSSGRGFVEAWSIKEARPTFLWRDYVIPPQDGSYPGWSLSSVDNMIHARVFNGSGAVDLKALPRGQLEKTLQGDWGNFGFHGKRSYAGAGVGWGGSWAINEASGVAFISTSTATPDWNATLRPGLNLWSDSVLALNLTDGRMIWGFQAIPHPLGDFDCSWNVVLANETINGQKTPVVFKGCKDGYIFALDARNGGLLWFLKPPSIRWTNFGILDPLNSTLMTRYNWDGYPWTGKIVLNPSDTGALESDIAFDPTNGMLFAAVYNSPKAFQFTEVGSKGGPFNLTDWEFNWGVDVFNIEQRSPVNSTVMGIDGATGHIVWSHLIENLPYRGGLTVTGGVVYTSTLDGVLRYLNENSGSLLGQKSVGGSLIAQPSVAEDRNGTERLFFTDMGSSRWGPVFPGFVQALFPTAPIAQSSGSFGTPFYAAAAISAVLAGAVVALLIRGRKRMPTGRQVASDKIDKSSPSRSRIHGIDIRRKVFRRKN